LPNVFANFRLPLGFEAIDWTAMDKTEFVKFHGATVADDWRRVNALYEICETTSGVRTAKPLRLNANAQQIVYERLKDIAPLLHRHPISIERFAEIGAVLARLHSSDKRSNPILPATPYPLTFFQISEEDRALLDKKCPIGWFHSDCWYGNFFLDTQSELILIDPLPDGYTVKPGYYYACGAVDLAVLHMSLYFCQSAAAVLRMNWPYLLSAGEAVIDGYLNSIGVADATLHRTVLRLSRAMAVNHIASYHSRLVLPLAVVKTMIGKNILNRLDGELNWGRQ
jgi:hypothetical protein